MSTSKWIQVDDTDSGISYTGSWFQDNGSQNNLGNFGPPFLKTLHGTNTDTTSSFSYSFRGSRVLITGTVQYPFSSGTSNPSWQCIIDGQAVGMLLYTNPENRLRLCERDGMDASQLHTITVTVSVSDQHTFWFDYVQYLPADSTTISNAYVSIDSSDPGIQFIGGWNSSYPGYVTSTTGASLTFQFEGVSIQWLGFYDNQFPMKATTATYSIDGGTAASFTVDGSGASSPGVLYNQILFQTGQLSSGSHTLTVVYQGNSNTTPLGLYTLVVQNGPGGSSGSGTSGTGATGTVGSVTTGGSSSSRSASAISGATSSTTGTIGAASATFVSLPGISASQADTISTSSGLSSTSVVANGGGHDSSNVGPIIGGVIGGLALVLIAIFGFFWLRRQKNRDSNLNILVDPYDPQMASYQTPTDPSSPFSDAPTSPSSQLQPLRASKRALLDTQRIHPFTDVKHTRTTSQDDSVGQTPTSTSRSGENPSVSNLRNSSSRNFGDLHDTSPAQSSFSISNPQSSPGVLFAVDQDSGIRFRRTLQDGQMVQILPPVYSAS